MHKEKSSKRVKVFLSELIVCSSIVVFSIVFLAIAGCRPAAEVEEPEIVSKPEVAVKPKITKGPFLLRVYQDRAALMWETNTNVDCKLSYGKGEKATKHISSEGEELNYEVRKGRNEVERKSVFVHKVWLEGLEAGQVYSYKITAGSAQSEVYKFRAVPKETDEVRFAVYGDNRSNPQGHRKIVELMKAQDVDFVVNSGDLVGSGGNFALWEREFFEPLKDLAATVPVYIAKGNHDLGNGYYEKLLVPTGEGNHFGFDYGPIHYFCADNVSNILGAKELLGMIAADAVDSDALWRFVSYHVPSVNFGGHWSRWGYPFAMPAFSEAGIDFVITGHSHQYERFRPVIASSEKDAGYVTYITSGGGGAPTYDVTQTACHAYSDKTHHFCLFHIQGNNLTMDVIDIEGRIIDHLEVTKSDGRLNDEYLETAIPMEAIDLHYRLHNVRPLPLANKPKKHQPFTVNYNLLIAPLAQPCEITFELRCEDGSYELPEAKTIEFAQNGGVVSVELTAKALVEVTVRETREGRVERIRPALWLDCHYKIGQIEESISHSVRAKPEKRQ